MPCRLNKERIVTMRTVRVKSMEKAEIGDFLGVSEDTVRYLS